MTSPAPGVRSRVRRYYLFQVLVAFQIWSPFWSLWLMLRLNDDYFLATVVDVAFWLVSLAVSIPAGALADRYGRRPALLVGVGIWLSGIVLFGFATTFEGFILANAVWAFGAAFLWGAGSAFLYDTLVEARLEARYPALSSGVALYSFLGTAAASLIGGLIVNASGRLDLTLIVYAVPGIAAFLVVWTFHEPSLPRTSEPSLVELIRSGTRTTARNRQIVLVIVFQVLIGVVTYAMAFFRPKFLSEVTGDNNLLIGVLYSIFFLCAAASGSTVGRILHRFGETGGLLLGFLLVFPPFALVYVVSKGYFSPDLSLVLGVLSQVFDYTFWGIETPLITTILNRRVTSADRATVLAINSFFTTMVIAVLEPPLGLAATESSIGVALAGLAAAVSIPTAAVLLWFRRSVRRNGVLGPEAGGAPAAVSIGASAAAGSAPVEDLPANQFR